MAADDELRSLYFRLIEGWNAADAEAMAGAVTGDGLVIGVDGSQMLVREQVAAELGRIFADHETASYVTKVRSVTAVGDSGGLLLAVAGMVPPRGSELMPERNAIQSVAARRTGDGWEVVLFQTTPACFDGRPELVDALTAELSELLG
jgi:uncharacterized protein (TIGR02246 family)